MCYQVFGATQPKWEVNPKVCLTNKLSDSCKMLLHIALSDLPTGNYCLYQDDRLLRCFRLESDYLEQNISYQEKTLLSLKNEAGQALLSQQLVVKARQNQTVKRRVRQPWSLF